MNAKSKKMNITVAEFLTRHIDALLMSKEKTQKQIADELGYEKPNIITMFKQGKTNLPLNKVGAMAKAINVDKIYLLRLVLSEYVPETYVALEEMLSGNLITDNEKQIIDRLRILTNESNPQLIDERQVEALTNFANALMENQPK